MRLAMHRPFRGREEAFVRTEALTKPVDRAGHRAVGWILVAISRDFPVGGEITRQTDVDTTGVFS